MTEVQTDIAEAAAGGNEQAFRQLYDHYVPFVWRTAYRMADSNGDLASQITQDVFVRVHQGLRKFDGKAALSTWLYRIVYNRALSVLARERNHRSRVTELPENLASEGHAAKLEAREEAQRLLASLNRQERFLLIAREVEGMPFDELAVIMGKNAGALRTQVSRIKDTLRREATNGKP